MRVVLLLSACAWCAVVGQDINAMRDMPKYDTRYDYLDVDAILDSKRLVRNYVDCLINAQRCTPEGKALKRILPEALRTKCVRCTEKQKRTAVKVIKRLKYEYPVEWAKLSSRWDPTGDFTRYFEEFLAKEHFNTLFNPGNTIGSSPAPPPPAPVPLSPEVQTQAPYLPSQPPLIPFETPARPPSNTVPPVDMSTPPRPAILNRFGEDGELMMGSPSSGSDSAASRPSPTTKPPPRPTMRPLNRPTHTTWAGEASDSMPIPIRPMSNFPQPITFFDQIGFKIMRTTELVTDILRNTVRAVVGR